MAIKILVVDDEADLESLISKRFRNQIDEGTYVFSFALNASSAKEILQDDYDLDIMLLDINMPGMNGLDLLKQVREINPVIKVIMVTAYGDMQNIRTAMNEGAFDFLIKPVDFGDLELTIEKTYQQVKLIKKGMAFIKENETLKMYVHKSVINYLANNNLIEDLWKNSQQGGTAILFRLINFSAQCQGESIENIFRFLNYFYMSLNIHLDMPYIPKTIKYIVNSSVLVISNDSNHFLHAIETCLKVRHNMETIINRYPGQLNFSPDLTMAIYSGEILTGCISKNTNLVRENIVLSESIDHVFLLANHGKSEQIFMTEKDKDLLPDKYKTEGVGEVQLKVGEQIATKVFNLIG